jgi:hypothetical protein
MNGICAFHRGETRSALQGGRKRVFATFISQVIFQHSLSIAFCNAMALPPNKKAHIQEEEKEEEEKEEKLPKANDADDIEQKLHALSPFARAALETAYEGHLHSKIWVVTSHGPWSEEFENFACGGKVPWLKVFRRVAEQLQTVAGLHLGTGYRVRPNLHRVTLTSSQTSGRPIEPWEQNSYTYHDNIADEVIDMVSNIMEFPAKDHTTNEQIFFTHTCMVCFKLSF